MMEWCMVLLWLLQKNYDKLGDIKQQIYSLTLLEAENQIHWPEVRAVAEPQGSGEESIHFLTFQDFRVAFLIFMAHGHFHHLLCQQLSLFMSPLLSMHPLPSPTDPVIPGVPPDNPD